MKAMIASFTLASTLLLAACGGGSGGTSGGTSAATAPPPSLPTAGNPVYSPTVGAPNVPTNVIPTLTLSVTNASGTDGGAATFQCNNQMIVFKSASSLSADAKTVTVTFTPAAALPAGQGCSITPQVVTNGPGGSVPTPIDFSFTTAAAGTSGTTTTVLHYTEKVVASWNGEYPYMVTPTGVTEVTNATQYKSVGGSFALLNCYLAVPADVLSDGTIPVLCLAYQDSTYHLLTLNPVAQTLNEYSSTSGALSADLAYTLTVSGNAVASAGSGWVRAQAFDPAYPTWGVHVQVSSGTYYTLSNGVYVDSTTGLGMDTLYFQPQTGSASTVATGVGNLVALLAYSN